MKKRKTKPITTKAAILLALPDGSINGTRTYRSNKIAKNENPAKENPICNRFIPGKLAAPTDNERLHIYPQQNKKPKSAN
jgi:ribosomal protein S2